MQQSVEELVQLEASSPQISPVFVDHDGVKLHVASEPASSPWAQDPYLRAPHDKVESDYKVSSDDKHDCMQL